LPLTSEQQIQLVTAVAGIRHQDEIAMKLMQTQLKHETVDQRLNKEASRWKTFGLLDWCGLFVWKLVNRNCRQNRSLWCALMVACAILFGIFPPAARGASAQLVAEQGGA
jgi:hypothetical protein